MGGSVLAVGTGTPVPSPGGPALKYEGICFPVPVAWGPPPGVLGKCLLTWAEQVGGWRGTELSRLPSGASPTHWGAGLTPRLGPKSSPVLWGPAAGGGGCPGQFLRSGRGVLPVHRHELRGRCPHRGPPRLPPQPILHATAPPLPRLVGTPPLLRGSMDVGLAPGVLGFVAGTQVRQEPWACPDPSWLHALERRTPVPQFPPFLDLSVPGLGPDPMMSRCHCGRSAEAGPLPRDSPPYLPASRSPWGPSHQQILEG